MRRRDRARLAADHGQRVLERVREVAGLSPGALQERCVVVEQRVELVDERLHLARKALGQARGRARANVSESQPHALQGQQAVVHLRHHGADQTERQHGKRHRELGAELAHVLMDVDGRAGDRIDEPAGRSRQGDRRDDRAQPFAPRPGQLLDTVVSAGRADRQALGPQRLRALDDGVALLDLPVPAGLRPVETRVERRPAELERAVRPDLARGRELLQMVRECGIEAALDVILEQQQQEQPGGAQRAHDPDRRRGDQPERKRSTAHGSGRGAGSPARGGCGSAPARASCAGG